ncbi:MAG: CrcB family protein [Actinomycetota bacterium]|nr:CrcB family protein [Actinomycetota bacterium]
MPVDPDLADGAHRAIRDRRRAAAQRAILLVVGAAGILGALSRYAVSRLLPTPAGRFPWSTFWINITGSLVIGFVLVLLTERFPRARVARPLVATGFLGAYTTFSTYMVDADLLFRGHDLAMGAEYAVGSLLAGGGAALVGIWLGRFLMVLDRHLDEHLGS